MARKTLTKKISETLLKKRLKLENERQNYYIFKKIDQKSIKIQKISGKSIIIKRKKIVKTPKLILFLNKKT